MSLKRKWIIPDSRGRITIPTYMRKALDLTNTPITIEAYPDLETCTCLIIKSKNKEE